MKSIIRAFEGDRPDITPAQVPGLIAAIAVVLNVFGVYHLNDQQTAALIGLVVVVVGLFGADAKIRGDRNKADGTIVSAGILKNGTSSAAPTFTTPLSPISAVAGQTLPPIGGLEDELPDDAVEFASPPPSDDEIAEASPPPPGAWSDETPIQPSEDGLR